MEDLGEVERNVLGTWLSFPELIAKNSRVRPTLFGRKAYANLCSTLLAMSDEGEPIDTLSVWDRFKKDHGGHGIDGTAGLWELMSEGDASPAGQISHHVKRLERASLLRGLRFAAASVLEATEGQEEPTAILEEWETTISQVFAMESMDFRPIMEGLKETIERIDLAFQGKVPLGVQTGIAKLDELFGGWQPGDLAILGGRPGMGKSAFILHTMKHAAKKGKHVSLLTMEMTEFDMDCRMLGAEDVRLLPSALRQGKITNLGWTLLTQAASVLGAFPISILDRPAMTLSQLRRSLRSLHAKKPVDLLILDYLQLIQSEGKRIKREEEVSDVSKGLKRLAKELKIPILATASLNRQCENRAGADKRPQLSDLRESGNLESDADLVIFLYRDEFYNKETEDPGICEFLVRKSRHGGTGEARVYFDGPSMTFHPEAEVRNG